MDTGAIIVKVIVVMQHLATINANERQRNEIVGCAWQKNVNLPSRGRSETVKVLEGQMQ
jgi:hypothetical protein